MSHYPSPLTRRLECNCFDEPARDQSIIRGSRTRGGVDATQYDPRARETRATSRRLRRDHCVWLPSLLSLKFVEISRTLHPSVYLFFLFFSFALSSFIRCVHFSIHSLAHSLLVLSVFFSISLSHLVTFPEKSFARLARAVAARTSALGNRGYDRYCLRAFRPHNSCNSRHGKRGRVRDGTCTSTTTAKLATTTSTMMTMTTISAGLALALRRNTRSR